MKKLSGEQIELTLDEKNSLKIQYTDSEGFRRIDDRYCVAIGTAFGVKSGQLFDVTLENGTTIKCIVGDIKKEFEVPLTIAGSLLLMVAAFGMGKPIFEYISDLFDIFIFYGNIAVLPLRKIYIRNT